jgi:hypothetical protein
MADRKQEPYAKDAILFYPGHRLSDDEKRRMDGYEIEIDEITVDHLVYAMSKQIENNFQTFYTVAEEVVGEEQALRIANEIGRRYGGRGYATLLAARGLGKKGSARMMALYQDLVHSIRGPKHAAALYAEYDDERCVVRRKECIYYNEQTPQNGKYTEAFELGCFDGYKAADENLLRVEVHRCRYRGDSGCEQHWVYKEPKAGAKG